MALPRITINGTVLTEAQAMTLHVALGSFQIDLTDQEFVDGIGAELATAYQARAREVMTYAGGGTGECPRLNT
jgi:hypothetical protein